MGLAGIYLKIMQQLAQELVFCTEILQALLQLQQKDVWRPPSHQVADKGWMMVEKTFTNEVALTDESVLRIVQGSQCECGGILDRHSALIAARSRHVARLQ